MTLYLITYDISDDRRRHKVAETLLGWGRRLQYSVFECALSERQRVHVEADLDELIHHDQDQILIVALGPLGGGGGTAIHALGRSYTPPTSGTIIV